ncbi:hypothetical protein ACOSP7_015160 [Xanthoceras sorbifolium]
MLNMIINKFVVEWTQAVRKEDKRYISDNLLISWRDNCSGIIYAGGVIRDNNSNWVKGFAMNIGYGSVLEVELQTLCKGLKMVWNVGIEVCLWKLTLRTLLLV